MQFLYSSTIFIKRSQSAEPTHNVMFWSKENTEQLSHLLSFDEAWLPFPLPKKNQEWCTSFHKCQYCSFTLPIHWHNSTLLSIKSSFKGTSEIPPQDLNHLLHAIWFHQLPLFFSMDLYPESYEPHTRAVLNICFFCFKYVDRIYWGCSINIHAFTWND